MENKKVMNRIQDLGAVIALILLVAVISIISPEFRTVKNFLSLLRQSSINGLIAFEMCIRDRMYILCHIIFLKMESAKK